MEALVPEPLVLDDEDALAFMRQLGRGRHDHRHAAVCPVDVGRQLEAWGFDVVAVDVSEFLKAGGGCRCLTLALDVVLGNDEAGNNV